MHLRSFFAQTVTFFFLVFRSTSNYRAKTHSCSQLGHILVWLHGQRLKISRLGSALYGHLYNSENLTADFISPLNTKQLFVLHSVVLSTFLFSSFFSTGVFCALGLWPCSSSPTGNCAPLSLPSLSLQGTPWNALSRPRANVFFPGRRGCVRLLVRMRMTSRVPLLTRSLANIGQALFFTRCWPSFWVPRTRASGPDRRFCQTPKLLSMQINWITRRYASRSV